MAMRTICFLLVAPAMMNAVEERANPIRKVVTMLQNMQKQVTEEGEHQAELFDKFMCYCKNGRGTLEASIADAENKMANLEATVGESAAKKKNRRKQA
jgi:hypothetical protein